MNIKIALFLYSLLICSHALSAQIQIGSDIDGDAEGDYSGESVSLSSDGTRLAIGASSNSENGDNSGHVRIFDDPESPYDGRRCT